MRDYTNPSKLQAIDIQLGDVRVKRVMDELRGQYGEDDRDILDLYSWGLEPKEIATVLSLELSRVKDTITFIHLNIERAIKEERHVIS